MSDPVEDFIDTLRPVLRRYNEQFLRGEVTGIEIEGRLERKQRCENWNFRVKPETDEKVIAAWGFDTRRERTLI